MSTLEESMEAHPATGSRRPPTMYGLPRPEITEAVMRRLRQKRYTSTARANRESRATEQDREHGAEIRADHILGQLGWYEEFNAALAPLREPLHATELFGHRMEPDDALDYVQAQLRYDLVAMLRLVAAIVRQDDEEDG